MATKCSENHQVLTIRHRIFPAVFTKLVQTLMQFLVITTVSRLAAYIVIILIVIAAIESTSGEI